MTPQSNNNDKKEPAPKEPLLLQPGSITSDTTTSPEQPFINGEKRLTEEDRDPSTGMFVPGNQGGPGRPKGAMKMRSLVDEALQEMGAKDAQGKPVPIEKALVQKIVKMAVAGDRKMIELIWNYRDGKPPQFIVTNGQYVGKRKLSPEEIKHVDDLFGPKDWDEPEVELPTQSKTDNGPINPQPETDTKAGESDVKKDTNAEVGRPRGAYEGDS